MTWTYNATQIASSALYQVRRMIGDVLTADQQLQDEEITYILTQFSNNYAAGAECCRNIAAQYSRKADTVTGEMRTLYSAQQRAYAMRAAELQTLAMARGGALPYAGGISQTDKQNQVDDTDRVTPQFNLGIFDDLLPEAPVGNQVPGSPLADDEESGS